MITYCGYNYFGYQEHEALTYPSLLTTANWIYSMQKLVFTYVCLSLSGCKRRCRWRATWSDCERQTNPELFTGSFFLHCDLRAYRVQWIRDVATRCLLSRACEDTWFWLLYNNISPCHIHEWLQIVWILLMTGSRSQCSAVSWCWLRPVSYYILALPRLAWLRRHMHTAQSHVFVFHCTFIREIIDPVSHKHWW